MGFAIGRNPIFSIICLSAAALAAPTALPISAEPMELRLGAQPTVLRKRRLAVDALPVKYRRGKRAQAKPRRRPNRMHISKRVRRKHRRAA